jgi:gluconolactonase
MMKMKTLIFGLFGLVLGAQAQDTSLSEYLIEGESWKVAVEGMVFTDGLCVDAAGNLFYTDVKEGKGIYKWDAETGKTSLALDNLPGISGLQIGPDGKFYACHNKEQRVITIKPNGAVQVLVTGVKCNDLAVTKKGFVYFTETPTMSVHVITPDGQHRMADQGKVMKPNGITLSSDEQTLFVSEHGGTKVWAWQIQSDGSLTAGAPFMTMRVGHGKETAQGDGATTEAKGRIFVTTEIGIQIFDSAGRLSGVIDKPDPAGKVVSVEFAGTNHDVLFVAAGDKIYSRQLKTPGYFR